MEIEQVMKEFLKLVGQEKVKEAEELIVGEARVRENEVARHLVENGVKLNEGGLYAGALHCFEAARKIVRSDDLREVINQCLTMTHNNFAVLLMNRKKYEEAENHYTEALRINPECAEAHNNYANMLKILKKYKKAENHYTEALRINPECAEAHKSYADLLRIMKRYKEAENHTKRSSK